MESLIWFLGVAVAALIGEEVLGLSYQLCRLIVFQAAKNLPMDVQPRFVEETLAELSDIHGPFSRMWNAIDYFLTTRHMRAKTNASTQRKIYLEKIPGTTKSEISSPRKTSGQILPIVERILAALIILALLVLLIILAMPVPTRQ